MMDDDAKMEIWLDGVGVAVCDGEGVTLGVGGGVSDALLVDDADEVIVDVTDADTDDVYEEVGDTSAARDCVIVAVLVTVTLGDAVAEDVSETLPVEVEELDAVDDGDGVCVGVMDGVRGGDGEAGIAPVGGNSTPRICVFVGALYTTLAVPLTVL